MTAPQQQRRKIKGAAVITANRLWDGAVVYRTADDRWTTEPASAAIVTGVEEMERLLAGARADERHAVDAYAAPINQDFGAVAPINLRDRIRRDGPTIALPSSRVVGG